MQNRRLMSSEASYSCKPLIGGIRIMNIMLVSLTGRAREIGFCLFCGDRYDL